MANEGETNQEPVDLAQCYETFSTNVNEKIDTSVTKSGECLATSENDRNTLHSNTEEKEKLEVKIEALKGKFEICSEKDVDQYFTCHDTNVSVEYCHLK